MIDLARQGGLWRLTLRRPQKANAVTGAMLAELLEAVSAAKGEARALVLTGEGRVFSAGADLAEMQAGLGEDPLWEQLSAAIAELPCLSVAALNGSLAGGAFGMALACDLRVAVPGAAFFYPVLARGFLPQPSDPARLAALVGPARAKLILLGGARLEAEEALAIGLIDRLAPEDGLDTAVAALTEAALAAEPDHLAAIKALCP